MEKAIKYILTAVIFFLVGFYMSDLRKPDLKPETITITEYVPKIDTSYVPVYSVVYRDTGSVKIKVEVNDSLVYVDIPADTAEIIKDYLTERVYTKDTVINDVSFQSESRLFANRIVYDSYSLTNNRPLPGEVRKFNLGAGGIVGKNDASILVSVKYNNIQGLVGYNIVDPYGLKVGIIKHW